MWWLDSIGAAVMVVMVVVNGLSIPNKNQGRSNGTWSGNLGSVPSPTMVTWLIDGNNLSCSRKVPNDRETILRELSEIASPRDAFSSGFSIDNETKKKRMQYPKQQQRQQLLNQERPISNVVIVFDGNEDEVSDTTVTDSDRWLEWTVTDGRNRLKDRADDWIVNRYIPRLRELMEERMEGKKGSMRVNLVSADKDLQKRVRQTRILNGGSFVHPPRFWKDYLPVLQTQQQLQQQQQKLEEGS